MAFELGNRAVTLTADTLGHLEDLKRASLFYLRGLDGSMRALIHMYADDKRVLPDLPPGDED